MATETKPVDTRTNGRRAGLGLWLLLGLLALPAVASRVSLGGVMGEDRALLSVNGAPAKVMRVGEQQQDIKLIEVRRQSVLIEVGGQRREVRLGGMTAQPEARAGQRAQAVLNSDGRGHFQAAALVNGRPVNFLVDTGASAVVLPRGVAERAGVSLTNASLVWVETANGRMPAQRVLLNNLRVDGIELNLVEALVVDDHRLPTPLLGMSFLRRTDIRQEGGTMTLTLRY
jgi:aspartyl protease family protein